EVGVGPGGRAGGRRRRNGLAARLPEGGEQGGLPAFDRRRRDGEYQRRLAGEGGFQGVGHLTGGQSRHRRLEDLQFLGRRGDDVIVAQRAQDVGGQRGRATGGGACDCGLQVGARLGDLAVELLLAHPVADDAALLLLDSG